MAEELIAPPEAPPPPPPAPEGEIHVTPAAVDRGPKAPPPPKGSARDRLNERLRGKVKPQFFETPPKEEKTSVPASPPEQKNAGDSPSVTPTPDQTDTPVKEAGGDPTPPASTAPEKGKKPSPWKLVDEYKARAAKAEAEALELKNSGLTPEERKSLESLKKQNEELENEIRFVNYAKSQEFKSKFEEPYEKAWQRALKEVTQITVTDAQGQTRKAEFGDLSALVNMGLQEARDYADQTFGKFADDMMGYRKEILGLWENQQAALKEAKEKGIARDKEREEQSRKALTQTTGQIKELWDKANEGFLNDKENGALFKPVEGDQDGNQRLAKGFELVDKAFSENPADPNLTPEQRAAVVKRHAAVRMRAAAFGRANAQRLKLQARVTELEAELAKYKESVPGTGGRTQSPTNGQAQQSGWNRIRDRLNKAAQHPT